MDIQNPLIEWYIPDRSHCLVQRQRCPRMVQTTRLVHHVLVKCQRDLARLSIVHRPHCPDYRTEPSKLHRRRKMDHLVRTVFISDGRMTRREIRKFGVLEFAPDDPLDCKVPIVQSESGLDSERLLPVWETMTRKVDPFVLAKLFNDPGNTRIFSIYVRERREALDALTNVIQFHAY